LRTSIDRKESNGPSATACGETCGKRQQTAKTTKRKLKATDMTDLDILIIGSCIVDELAERAGYQGAGKMCSMEALAGDVKG
jgi:hypothetical protein